MYFYCYVYVYIFAVVQVGFTDTSIVTLNESNETTNVTVFIQGLFSTSMIVKLTENYNATGTYNVNVSSQSVSWVM